MGVFEVRNIYGKYFVFHMNLAIQEAFRILDESIISIEKDELIKHSVKFLLQRELMMFVYFDVFVISAMNTI